MQGGAISATPRLWAAKRASRMAGLTVLDAALAVRRTVARRPPRTRRPARVLLAASNKLMAEHLLRIWASASDPLDARAWLTRFPDCEAWSPRVAELGIEWQSMAMGRLKDWDLILQADHMSLQFPPSVPKVMVGHGIAWGRMVKAGSYRYDPDRVFWPDGRRVYELMFDAADLTADLGRSWLPAYRDRIRVVGSLAADEMLDRRAGRDTLREKLGVGNRRLVVVMSSWGPHGLVPRYGRELLDLLPRLVESGDFAFALTMHQNLWSGTKPAGDWAGLLRSAEQKHVAVIGPDEDAVPYLAASDAAITDHTSFGTVYAVLGQPLIPMYVPPDSLTPGTYSRWLMDAHSPLRSVDEVEVALRATDERYVPRGGPEFISRLGQSRELVQAALLEVLPVRTQPRPSTRE